MREGDVVVEPGRTPDAARLNAVMVWGRDFDVIGRAALGEQHSDVVVQLGLVALYGEVVVRLASHQVVG